MKTIIKPLMLLITLIFLIGIMISNKQDSNIKEFIQESELEYTVHYLCKSGGLFMIKAILFDWHGVLVESTSNNNQRTENIYNKLLQNTATKDEIIEIVTSYRKYEPLWEVLPILRKHFKMCVVNNGPKATYSYWDEYYGYSEFMGFVNSEIEGVEKPQPEIYKIACERLGVEPSEVIYMDDSCGFPEETEKLNMKFIHWRTTEEGFREFKKYLNKHTEVQI